MPLSKGLREFVGLLNANKVEYLVVGAFAVAWHGVPRYTADLDLFVRSSPENAERVLRVLSQFGFGNLGIGNRDFQEPDKVIQLGVSPNRIDLLTSISGVTSDEGWSTRVQGDLDGVDCSANQVRRIGCARTGYDFGPQLSSGLHAEPHHTLRGLPGAGLRPPAPFPTTSTLRAGD